jgi:hypothetical protein
LYSGSFESTNPGLPYQVRLAKPADSLPGSTITPEPLRLSTVDEGNLAKVFWLDNEDAARRAAVNDKNPSGKTVCSLKWRAYEFPSAYIPLKRFRRLRRIVQEMGRNAPRIRDHFALSLRQKWEAIFPKHQKWEAVFPKNARF